MNAQIGLCASTTQPRLSGSGQSTITRPHAATSVVVPLPTRIAALTAQINGHTCTRNSPFSASCATQNLLAAIASLHTRIHTQVSNHSHAPCAVRHSRASLVWLNIFFLIIKPGSSLTRKHHYLNILNNSNNSNNNHNNYNNNSSSNNNNNNNCSSSLSCFYNNNNNNNSSSSNNNNNNNSSNNANYNQRYNSNCCNNFNKGLPLALKCIHERPRHTVYCLASCSYNTCNRNALFVQSPIVKPGSRQCHARCYSLDVSRVLTTPLLRSFAFSSFLLFFGLHPCKLLA
jgi:hypothetical protein